MDSRIPASRSMSLFQSNAIAGIPSTIAIASARAATSSVLERKPNSGEFRYEVSAAIIEPRVVERAKGGACQFRRLWFRAHAEGRLVDQFEGALRERCRIGRHESDERFLHQLMENNAAQRASAREDYRLDVQRVFCARCSTIARSSSSRSVSALPGRRRLIRGNASIRSASRANSWADCAVAGGGTMTARRQPPPGSPGFV
jgi:hypothetical protein